LKKGSGMSHAAYHFIQPEQADKMDYYHQNDKIRSLLSKDKFIKIEESESEEDEMDATKLILVEQIKQGRKKSEMRNKMALRVNYFDRLE